VLTEGQMKNSSLSGAFALTTEGAIKLRILSAKIATIKKRLVFLLDIIFIIFSLSTTNWPIGSFSSSKSYVFEKWPRCSTKLDKVIKLNLTFVFLSLSVILFVTYRRLENPSCLLRLSKPGNQENKPFDLQAISPVH